MDKFNGSHLLFIIWGTTAVSLKTYPSIYTALGGRDSWIAITCSSILIFLFACIIINISQKNNNFNMYNIYCTAVGKALANIFIFFFILTLILTLIECSSVEANAMHINMLPNTPVWFFVLCLAVPAVYTILKGKTSIIIVTIIAITLIIASGILVGILTQKYRTFSLLFPIMNNGINKDFILCIVKSLGIYGCFSIIIPFFTEISNKKIIRKYSLCALLFVMQMQIFSAVSLFTTFGPRRINSIYYPKLIQTQLIDYFGFIESGELYVLLQIIGGWYVKYILTFLSLILLLRKMKIKNNYIIYILSILVIIISALCSSDTFRLFKLLDYYSYFCLINFILIPLAVYIIFNLKNKKNIETA